MRCLPLLALATAGVLLAAPCVGVAAQASDSLALSVSLFRVAGDEPGFELNRAAYVAIFEVRPGEGVAQLFPDNTEMSRTSLPKGRSYLQGSRAQYNRQISRAQYNYAPQGSSGIDVLRTPRTILIVASDRPLRVAGPASTAATLRRVERLRSLRTGRVTMEDLMAIIEAVRPEAAGAELVTDVLELGPGG